MQNKGVITLKPACIRTSESSSGQPGTNYMLSDFDWLHQTQIGFFGPNPVMWAARAAAQRSCGVPESDTEMHGDAFQVPASGMSCTILGARCHCFWAQRSGRRWSTIWNDIFTWSRHCVVNPFSKMVTHPDRHFCNRSYLWRSAVLPGNKTTFIFFFFFFVQVLREVSRLRGCRPLRSLSWSFWPHVPRLDVCSYSVRSSLSQSFFVLSGETRLLPPLLVRWIFLLGLQYIDRGMCFWKKKKSSKQLKHF